MTTSKRLRRKQSRDGQADSPGYSQAVIHASLLVLPGSDLEQQITGISGRLYEASLQVPGPAGACLRTLLATSRWVSTTCWLTWKRKVTPAGRSFYRLQASAPRIAAIESGSLRIPDEWWTPTASIGTSDFTLTPNMGNREERGAGHGGNLLNQMAQRMWPTPRAGKTTDEDEASWMARHARGDVSTPPLSLAVKMWPTPTTQDAANNGGPSQYQRNSLPLNTAVMAPDGMKLSAAWVTRLMGYPDGWLDLPPE